MHTNKAAKRTLAQLIDRRRERLLALEANNAPETKAAAPVTLPAPETQCSASAGTENSTVAQDPSPVAQPDAAFQHMQSIGRAESWKTNEPPEHHAGNFGPYPEEYE